MTASDTRDIAAYELARRYLLGFAAHGITDEILAHYLAPPQSRLCPSDLPAVYLRLLESAQNRGMMATVIGKSIGSVKALSCVLCAFDPHEVIERFQSPAELLDTIEQELKPRGKVRRVSGGLWPLFARAALSGANFLSQFATASEFCDWVRVFDEDPRKRAALPFLLGVEIEGFGFALSCDFLKELGFLNFAKPDVHVKAIVKGLGLCPSTADDYLVFKTVVRIASHCEVTAYNVDKLFWLVGSGYFYDHQQFGKRGRIPTDREQFIRSAKGALAQPNIGLQPTALGAIVERRG